MPHVRHGPCNTPPVHPSKSGSWSEALQRTPRAARQTNAHLEPREPHSESGSSASSRGHYSARPNRRKDLQRRVSVALEPSGLGASSHSLGKRREDAGLFRTASPNCFGLSGFERMAKRIGVRFTFRFSQSAQTGSANPHREDRVESHAKARGRAVFSDLQFAACFLYAPELGSARRCNPT